MPVEIPSDQGPACITQEATRLTQIEIAADLQVEIKILGRVEHALCAGGHVACLSGEDGDVLAGLQTASASGVEALADEDCCCRSGEDGENEGGCWELHFGGRGVSWR